MSEANALAAFQAERTRLAQLTKKGIGMPAAGLLFWIAVAVLFGSHFLPYARLYESRAYLFLTASVAAVLSVGTLATSGPLYLMTPVLTAACYAVTVILLWREVATLRPEET